jgi:hypothetical protein
MSNKKSEAIHNVTAVDRYEPDYAEVCVVCGAGHVVTAVRDSEVAYHGEMCGVCTWGESAMADPAAWNS